MIETDDLRFLAAIAASPSLAAAARMLDVSPPAVTQRLRGLETRLGVRLVDRGGRRLALTGEGELLAKRGREIVGALDALNDTLLERRGEVAGDLRVVAPFGFGRRYVASLAAQFRAEHPRLRLDLSLLDRLSHAPDGSWDIAIHIGAPEVSARLTMRRLAPNARVLCASPGYLARAGVPARPADLRTHACIALRENDEDVTMWPFRARPGGAVERVRIAPFLSSNDGEVVKAWALAGHGLIVRSEWDVAEDLRAGRLVRVLDDYDLPPAPVVALMGTEPAARSARARAFLDAIVARLRTPPWRVSAADADAAG
ncbi:Transcriptional regulator, LysR family [uncultured Alphaproteobacteria bacterium]|uniref:Transcriptional regulator, LysR family n=1 Tax=uncultured Alphaproteobacteria bacterium TaxID=91750 RepID=A0A212JGM8_9PROT|nr:Transcriptional regulator, LysR family [uncultured Alphaproteobacteria bacterium]